jgi:hypothetical protein
MKCTKIEASQSAFSLGTPLEIMGRLLRNFGNFRMPAEAGAAKAERREADSSERQVLLQFPHARRARSVKQLIFSAGVAVVVGCTTTTYAPYVSAPDSKVIQGTGGSRKVVQKMEVWRHGTPPRRFRILGIIDDKRPDGPLLMAGQEYALVRKAREAGGDAVIITDAQHQLEGLYHHDSSGAARRRVSQAVVIKYEDNPPTQ